MTSEVFTSDGKDLTFSDLREQLKAVRDKRFDLIVNSSDLKVNSPCAITTPPDSKMLTSDGVGLAELDWELTPHAFQQWCSKFNVPTKYLSGLADWTRSDGTDDARYQDLSMTIMRTHHRAEKKDILFRGVTDDDGTGWGKCRAILSPSYSFIENFDVLTAVFDGLRVARETHNVSFEPGPASVNDNHMRARINMPQLSCVADALLADYVSPFTGNKGLDNPVVFMGIEIRNSEVGAGSFTLVPSIIIEVCDNRLTLTEDIFRKVHLGSAMEKGQVSIRTMEATMELITAQTIDKVVEIANPAFLQAKIDELLELKSKVLAPTVVGDYLKNVFADDVADALFDEFILGSDYSAFGVAQAVYPRLFCDD